MEYGKLQDLVKSLTIERNEAKAIAAGLQRINSALEANKAESNNLLNPEPNERSKFESAIAGALKSCIAAHGPITKGYTSSAAKRVLGLIKQRDQDEVINLKAKLDAAQLEIKRLTEANTNNSLFNIPNAFFESYQRYIKEIPSGQIVNGALLVSKDTLIETVNLLKNGLTDDMNTALKEADILRKKLKEAQDIEKDIETIVELRWAEIKAERDRLRKELSDLKSIIKNKNTILEEIQSNDPEANRQHADELANKALSLGSEWYKV